jgi:hypothetical protein
MNTLEAFQEPALENIINGTASNILIQLDGSTYATALAALFSVFIGVCQQAGYDPGSEFERTLATLEGRRQATHRAPALTQ